MDRFGEDILRSQLGRENPRIVGGKVSSRRRKPESTTPKPIGDIPSMARNAVSDLEGEIGTILRTRLLENGAKIDCVLTLGEADIDGPNKNLLQSFVGSQFFKLSTGSWQGEGGTYGLKTFLGQALEKSQKRQLEEEKKST